MYKKNPLSGIIDKGKMAFYLREMAFLGI